MKNTHYYLLAITLIVLSSCTKRSPLKQYIHDADKVEVMIYSDNEPQLQFIANDFDTIQAWMNYISDSTAIAPDNCTLEGQLVFVQYNDSLPMKFSMKKGCTMVHYTMGGKNFVQPLTSGGISYINSLENRNKMFGR